MADEQLNDMDIPELPASGTLTEAAADLKAAITQLPRRRPGRPRGSRVIDGKVVAPTNVDVDVPERGSRRRTSGRRSKGEPLLPQDVVDILMMAHDSAALILGPEARIDEADAQKVAVRAAVVADDFGIEVAGKIMHLVLFFAAVASVEAPVIFRVMLAQQARAAARRNQQMTVQGAPVTQPVQPAPPSKNSGSSIDPEELAKILGVSVGTPNGVE